MSRILICVPCHNRRRIVEQCVPTVVAGMADVDELVLYNDGSTEYDDEFLMGLGADIVVSCPESIGIEKQRRNHFNDFSRFKATHLYLTDSDALHDPHWRTELLRLQDAAGGRPVCGYNTKAHSGMAGNTIHDDGRSEIIFRRFAPGISYLLTAAHVQRVIECIAHMPDPLHWDWTVPMLLGHMMATSRTSYVDHIGHGGLHHPKDAGYDDGDRASNPTQFLIQKRAQVVKALSG